MYSAALYTEHYQQDKTNQLVEQHLDMVKRIAFHLKSKLPAQVQVEDLIQSGMVGLIEAARNFDENQGASFETYAGIRVRGAMLDEIRKNDWTPRSVHRNTRMIAKVITEVENDKGREASACEIAEKLDVSIQDYHQMLLDTSTHRVLSFEDLGINDDSIIEHIPNRQPLIVDGLQQQDLKQIVAQAITELPPRESLIMALYYDEELNLREIGLVLGVTESRVSQIHSQAMIRLQTKLKCIIEEAKN